LADSHYCGKVRYQILYCPLLFDHKSLKKNLPPLACFLPNLVSLVQV
jgi:hypothetical protein